MLAGARSQGDHVCNVRVRSCSVSRLVDLRWLLWGPCTCTMRINPPGSPVDCHRGKKAYTKGLSGPPSGPLPPRDALEASRVDAPRPLRPPSPWRLPPTTAGSPLRGLRPRRYPKQRLCRKIAFSRQNPKIVYWKINNLRVQTFLFSVICDRATERPPVRRGSRCRSGCSGAGSDARGCGNPGPNNMCGRPVLQWNTPVCSRRRR